MSVLNNLVPGILHTHSESNDKDCNSKKGNFLRNVESLGRANKSSCDDS